MLTWNLVLRFQDLAAEKTYTNLDISVIEALDYRRNRFDGVASCLKTESLGTIMERIVNKEVSQSISYRLMGYRLKGEFVCRSRCTVWS